MYVSFPEVIYKSIRGRKVLIMEKEPDLALLMKTYFLRRECTVFVAHDLREGIRSLALHAPDVVLADPALLADSKEALEQIINAHPQVQLIAFGSEIVFPYSGLP